MADVALSQVQNYTFIAVVLVGATGFILSKIFNFNLLSSHLRSGIVKINIDDNEVKGCVDEQSIFCLLSSLENCNKDLFKLYFLDMFLLKILFYLYFLLLCILVVIIGLYFVDLKLVPYAIKFIAFIGVLKTIIGVILIVSIDNILNRYSFEHKKYFDKLKEANTCIYITKT